MPRLLRILGDDLHYHVIIRCNNKEHLLHPTEMEMLSDSLLSYKERFHFRIYDYVFMHTHVHLLLSTHGGHHLDKLMHGLCLSFAREYNNRHGRRGHMWGNRYWCRVVSDDRYALACMRYFVWNVLKAKVVDHPIQWRWCGYRFYAEGEANTLLQTHPTYLALGNDASTRQHYYRELIATPLSSEEELLFAKRRSLDSRRSQRCLNRIASHSHFDQ